MDTSDAINNNRWFWLKVVVVALFGALLLRLFTMQVTHGSDYRSRLMQAREERFFISAPRGRILDTNGNVLAVNQPVYNVIYLPIEGRVSRSGTSTQPSGSRSPEQAAADRLSAVLGLPPQELQARMDIGKQPQLSLTYPRRIFFNLDKRQVTYIREHQNQLPGFHVLLESNRQYRQNELASHTIGYLNSISAENWPHYRRKGYQLDSQVGVYGIEKQYESFLKGQNGALIIETGIDSAGAFKLYQAPSVPGYDVILNLDSRLQTSVEHALADQVRIINSNPKHKKVTHAVAVAMDPNTGGILALASYPNFDPNAWVGGISAKNYAKFQPAQQNWALQVPIPPGSTVKPLTVMLALQKGIITPKQTLFDPGRLQVGWEPKGVPHYLYCWDHRGHGAVDARKALAESCNVYMYQLSLQLGKYSADIDANKWLQKELPDSMQMFQKLHKQFGLGTSTGIDLPEEVSGNFQQTGQLADLPFAAIGQNQAYTAVQLVQYVSMLANGGNRMEPHVAKEIRTKEGSLIRRTEPKILNKVDISPTILQALREGMRDVVSKSYGTAYSSFQGAHYAAAGKTGTAETGRGEDNALFIGYAPYEHPKIAIAVIVPGGGHGSDSSVPIARKIMDSYFAEGK